MASSRHSGLPPSSRRRFGRRSVLLLLVVAFSLAAMAFPAWAGPGSYDVGRVVKVADGDTVTLDIDGQRVRVRLYGIDAPESGQKHGKQSTAFLKRIVRVGDQVEIQERDRDRYGRVVAWVIKDGVNVNQEMVRGGAAWWYRKYCKERQPCAVLARMEEDARAEGRGLWDDGDPEPPWEWRKENK